MVYLAYLHLLDFYGRLVGKYTSSSHGSVMGNSCLVRLIHPKDSPILAKFCRGLPGKSQRQESPSRTPAFLSKNAGIHFR